MRCAHPDNGKTLALPDADEDELYGEGKEPHEVGGELRRPRLTPPCPSS